MASSLKVESGMQLLARLLKKPSIEHFYPNIFENGPKYGDFIELYSDISINYLLNELISELLIPKDIGGSGAGVIVFNTDGTCNYNEILIILKQKLVDCLNHNNQFSSKLNLDKVEILMNSVLENLYIFEIYEPSQLYVNIQNLENVLIKHPNISLIVFNSISAFYWCEQQFKINKMDLYLKKLLSLIRKAIKDFKVTVLYTRPEYFSSSKETIENLEPCYENSSEDKINYRIQVAHNNTNNTYQVNVRTHDKLFSKKFEIRNNSILWH